MANGKANARRKMLERKYNALYKRVDNFEYKCFYCSSTEAIVLDHVPNLRYVEGLDTKHYLKNGGKFIYYPSCNECNLKLAACIYTDPVDRIDYLVTKLLKKIDEVEIWTPEEMAEIGHSLRSLIQNQQNKLAIMQERLKRLLDRSDELEGRPDNE
jgi:hypothetical protein